MRLLKKQEVITQARHYYKQSYHPNIYATFNQIHEGLLGFVCADTHSKEYKQFYFELANKPEVVSNIAPNDFTKVMDKYLNTNIITYYHPLEELYFIFIPDAKIVYKVPKSITNYPSIQILIEACTESSNKYISNILQEIVFNEDSPSTTEKPNIKVYPTLFKPSVSLIIKDTVNTVTDFVTQFDTLTSGKVIVVNSLIESSGLSIAKFLINISTNTALPISNSLCTESEVVKLLLNKQDTNWYLETPLIKQESDK